MDKHKKKSLPSYFNNKESDDGSIKNKSKKKFQKHNFKKRNDDEDGDDNEAIDIEDVTNDGDQLDSNEVIYLIN